MNGDSYSLSMKSSHIKYRMSVKKLKILSHVVAVVIGAPVCLAALLLLAWNNGKLLTQALLLHGAHRLNHCDVRASLSSRVVRSWHSKPNAIYSNPLELTQTVWHTWIENTPDSKVHGANMGPTWVPCGPHENCYLGQIPNPAGQMMAQFVTIRAIVVIEVWKEWLLDWFSSTRWPWCRESASSMLWSE